MNSNHLDNCSKALDKHTAMLSEWLKQISSTSAAMIAFVGVYMRPENHSDIAWVPYAAVCLLVLELVTILAAMVAHRGLWRAHLRHAYQIAKISIEIDHTKTPLLISSGITKVESFCLDSSFYLFMISICALSFSLIAILISKT